MTNISFVVFTLSPVTGSNMSGRGMQHSRRQPTNTLIDEAKVGTRQRPFSPPKDSVARERHRTPPQVLTRLV